MALVDISLNDPVAEARLGDPKVIGDPSDRLLA